MTLNIKRYLFYVANWYQGAKNVTEQHNAYRILTDDEEKALGIYCRDLHRVYNFVNAEQRNVCDLYGETSISEELLDFLTEYGLTLEKKPLSEELLAVSRTRLGINI